MTVRYLRTRFDFIVGIVVLCAAMTALAQSPKFTLIVHTGRGVNGYDGHVPQHTLSIWFYSISRCPRRTLGFRPNLKPRDFEDAPPGRALWDSRAS